MILTVAGRPVEFHCTAPVTANRAQQILYGATLKQFLVSDQIGTALLDKARSKLDIVIVDQRDLCTLSSTVQLPFVLTDSNEHKHEFDAEGNIRQLEGASYEIIGQSADQTDGLLKLFIETLPLSEPFDRIYQAMGEARADAA